jgi:DNA-binding NtrC family response regulator
MEKVRVLLSIPECPQSASLSRTLIAQGVATRECPAESLERTIEEVKPHVLVAGSYTVSPWNLLPMVKRIHAAHGRLPVILVTGESGEDLAVAVLRAGCSDYLRPPFDAAAMARAILEQISPAEVHSFADGHFSSIIGDSQKMRQVRSYLAMVAPTDISVLVTGETGTGKELVAESIHSASGRRAKPMVSINCAAIPDTLLESELFGYERGAFTGAYASREGKLQFANGGTVFLDEVGDMPPSTQAKMLRVLENREIQRLGGSQKVTLDVRVIAATNRNLEEMVADGKFRKDLYFRFNVARVHISPLKDRREDIPMLCDDQLTRLNRKMGRRIEGFTKEAMDRFLCYEWPGNVRELKNLVEVTFVTCTSKKIDLADLPESYQAMMGASPANSLNERQLLLDALTATHWNKSKTAEQLHWSRMTLYRKMAKLRVTGCNTPYPDDTAG